MVESVKRSNRKGQQFRSHDVSSFIFQDLIKLDGNTRALKRNICKLLQMFKQGKVVNLIFVEIDENSGAELLQLHIRNGLLEPVSNMVVNCDEVDLHISSVRKSVLPCLIVRKSETISYQKIFLLCRFKGWNNM